MALDFLSYTDDTTQQQTATAFDGTGLAQTSKTKTVRAVGRAVLDASTNPQRVAQATITVRGADAGSALTHVVIDVTPPVSNSAPLTEAQLAAYDTFVADIQAAVTAVEGGIDWGGGGQ